MEWAIAIGSYRMPQFVELCAHQCRLVFGTDTPIIVVDDKSDKSDRVEAVCAKYGCVFSGGEARKSHFSGDMQVFLTGLRFCEVTFSDVLLKLSQRLIPVLPSFKQAAEEAFADPKIQIVCPGRLAPNQIARPQAKFYGKFGILTDVFAVRDGAIGPEELLAVYRDRVTKPRSKSDSFSETTWGYLLAERFSGKHAQLPAWTNHQPLKPKAFLRKAQSHALEYKALADKVGIKGDWDTREWGLIEGKNYRAKPTRV